MAGSSDIAARCYSAHSIGLGSASISRVYQESLPVSQKSTVDYI